MPKGPEKGIDKNNHCTTRFEFICRLFYNETQPQKVYGCTDTKKKTSRETRPTTNQKIKKNYMENVINQIAFYKS